MTATEKVAPERKLPLTGPVPAPIAAKVAEYMKLPYTTSMVYDDSPGGPPAWVVWIEELDGCISQGDSPDEAMEMIREAMEGWLEVAVAYGDDIPPPKGPLRPSTAASSRCACRWACTGSWPPSPRSRRSPSISS